MKEATKMKKQMTGLGGAATALALPSLVYGSTQPPAQAAQRPNIIILLTDDQRYDSIGANNPNLEINTPHIDRLAREGVNFSNAFVTTPICAVSRACIISGRYSRNCRIHEFLIPFDDDIWETSYPFRMKQAGYFIGQLGKYGVGATQAQQNLFDLFDADLAQGEAFKTYEGEMLHDSEWLTRRTFDFLDKVPEGTPFVLQLNYKAPHPSAAVAPEDEGTLAGVEFTPPPSDTPEQRAMQHPIVARGLGAVSYPGDFGTPERRNAWIRRYLEKIISVDRSVGNIMEELERRGMADNTVLIFLSDHGTHYGEKGFTAKWTPYDPSLHIPFIVYDPRSPETAGTVRDELVLNLDVAPTILALAGLAEPGMDGRDVMPLVRGESVQDWRDEFFFEHQMSLATIPRPIPRNMGIRTHTEKYAVWIDPVPVVEEYYRLDRDPHEMHNLIAEAPEAAARLRARFEQWEEENPNTYDFMPYSHRPQTGAPDLDWDKFKAAHPPVHARIAGEIQKRGVTWQEALDDPELRWEIGLAVGFFY